MEAIVVGKNRVGLLKDIAQVFSNLKINILDHTSDHQAKNYSRIAARFLPKKNVHTATILTQIKKVKDVESVIVQEIKSK